MYAPSRCLGFGSRLLCHGLSLHCAGHNAPAETGVLAVTTEPGAQRLSDVVSDDDGGAFVAWTHQPNPYTLGLYLQHITFQGVLDWDTGPSGFPISTTFSRKLG